MSKKSFTFDGNLEHQKRAVESVISLFDFAKKSQDNRVNPEIDFTNFKENIELVQELNKINQKNNYDKHIVDIQMETGTGKTYTYTKTIFELNKKLGLSKFIVIVPTLSIKAGTYNFLTDESTKKHFRDQYNKEIKVDVLESNKTKKREYLPQAIKDFVEANSKDVINVLLINSGMINSSLKVNGEDVWSFEYQYEVNFFDNFSTILEALQSVKPIMIIDEPHKFKQTNKTWSNLVKINPQLIIRYGATFENDFNNLVYCLNAVNAFNKNLVKGIKVVIDEFDSGKKTNIKVKAIDKTLQQVTFEHNDGKKKIEKILSINDSLSLIDSNCINLKVEKIGSGNLTLSNGQILKTNDKINPYLFNQEFINRMIQKSVEKHFEIEKELMNKDIRIKPLTLFFIDDINSYRSDNGQGELVKYLEEVIKINIEKQLKDNDLTNDYRQYLKNSLDDLSQTHGGYFSKDNTGKDEKIQKEINEILHDKISLLDVNNPRRFIFSKWTLKEGWDNPNVFQITKLRTSGSETSKLQEVGRGLRIPVNEFMQRVDQEKEQHYLYYRVDFSENDFAQSLIDEINKTAKNIKIHLEAGKKISEKQINEIAEKLDLSPTDATLKLVGEKIIDIDKNILEGAQELFDSLLLNDRVNPDKVKIDTKEKPKECKIRENNYQKLKDLWEDINKQLILEYNIKEEEFIEYLKDSIPRTFNSNVIEKEYTINPNEERLKINDIINNIDYINTLNYGEFLSALSEIINIKVNTLHQVFVELKKENNVDISQYLTYETIKNIVENYYINLRKELISETKIKFKTVDATTKKTPFTDSNGNLVPVLAANLGTEYEYGEAPSKYLFDEIYYDSSLEKDNIKTNIDSVEVYTKIPKRSVKIPVPGGKSYSPDFAYVVKDKDGKSNLNLVVETKGKDEENLNKIEKEKFYLARLAFDGNVNITFEKQLSNKKIADIIEEIRNK